MKLMQMQKAVISRDGKNSPSEIKMNQIELLINELEDDGVFIKVSKVSVKVS